MGTRAIKEYRKSEDIKGKVDEAIYDAFLKGFAKCMEKVTKAFPNLNLKSIVIRSPRSRKKKKLELKQLR